MAKARRQRSAQQKAQFAIANENSNRKPSHTQADVELHSTYQRLEQLNIELEEVHFLRRTVTKLKADITKGQRGKAVVNNKLTAGQKKVLTDNSMVQSIVRAFDSLDIFTFRLGLSGK